MSKPKRRQNKRCSGYRYRVRNLETDTSFWGPHDNCGAGVDDDDWEDWWAG